MIVLPPMCVRSSMVTTIGWLKIVTTASSETENCVHLQKHLSEINVVCQMSINYCFIIPSLFQTLGHFIYFNFMFFFMVSLSD